MKRLAFIALVLFLITACAPAPMQTSEVSKTSEVSATFTPSPPPTLMPTTTSTPTETPVPSEVDLKPAYTETVHANILGAEIDAQLITDGSLDPVIRKVTVGEQAYAEFMAKSIYGVWENYHKGQSFETYMQMLAEVQQGKRNPLDISIPIYANDINDGIPYQNPDKSVNSAAQKRYLGIPWYKGAVSKSPDGTEVRALSEINIALVNGKRVKNITLFTDSGYTWGMGTNLDGDSLIFSSTIPFIETVSNKAINVANTLTYFKGWMISNIGGSITSWPRVDKSLSDILLDEGGLVIQ